MVATRTTLNEDFGTPDWLSVVNSDADDHLPALSADERVLVFASNRPGGAGEFDLWMAERDDPQGDFNLPVPLVELNQEGRDAGPSLSADGLTLYFISNRAASQGDDIWVSTRADRSSPFDEPVLVQELSTSGGELDVALSADGSELFYSSTVSGARELWHGIRDCP
jgi:Tol biopolymer transport system component